MSDTRPVKKYWVYERYIYETEQGPGMAATVTPIFRAADIEPVLKAAGILREAMTNLATLGGGRSHGNCIAQEALAEYQRLLARWGQ